MCGDGAVDDSGRFAGEGGGVDARAGRRQELLGEPRGVRVYDDFAHHPTAVDETHRRVMEITGADPLPYGVAASRPMIEAVIQYAAEQGILTRPATVDEMFPVKPLGLAD